MLLNSEKDLEDFISHFDPSVVGECFGPGVSFILLYSGGVEFLILTGQTLILICYPFYSKNLHGDS